MLKETCLDINVHLEGDIGLVRNVKEERAGRGEQGTGNIVWMDIIMVQVWFGWLVS